MNVGVHIAVMNAIIILYKKYAAAQIVLRLLGGTKLFIYYLLALVVVFIDQITKTMITKTMALGESIPLVEGVFHITFIRNRGAAFGIFQEARWFFIVVTIIVVVAIAWYMPRMRQQKLSLIAFSLILGGAIGNFIGRLLNGNVVDFLDFRLINFAIFNVADSAVTVGVVLLLLDALLESRRTRHLQGLRFNGRR